MKNETGRSAQPKLKIGELLVQDGLVTADQLQAALAAQNKQPIYMPLGEICVDMKLISREQLKKLLSKHQKRIPLGELLTNLGLVSAEQVQGCLKEQKSSSKKLGEILIGKGFLNENALISALNMQLGVPKMTPHASLIDKTLFNDINEAFLRRNNAIPAYKRGNELTVIMADPLDTAPIRDLESVDRDLAEPGRQVRAVELEHGVGRFSVHAEHRLEQGQWRPRSPGLRRTRNRIQRWSAGIGSLVKAAKKFRKAM